MILNVSATSQHAGTLSITLVDYGFLPTGPGDLDALVGGTLQNLGTFGAYKNHGVAIVSGSYGPGGFSDDLINSHGALGSYSMTLTSSIVHDAAGISTYNLDVLNSGEEIPTPEPTSLVLLGSGLIGLA